MASAPPSTTPPTDSNTTSTTTVPKAKWIDLGAIQDRIQTKIKTFFSVSMVHFFTERTFHPKTDKILKYWNIVQPINWLICILYYPFRTAFMQEDELPETYDFVLDVLVNIILVCNIFITSRTVVIEDGVPITDRKELMDRYKASSFNFDIVVALPLEILYTFFCYIFNFDPSRVIYFFIRLVRLLLITNITKLLTQVNLTMSIYIDSTVTRLLSLGFYIFITAHLIGCGYYFVGKMLGLGSDDWVPEAKWQDEGILSSYLYVFFWSLSNMTGGETDRGAPNNNIEFLFQMIVLIIGITTYATIIGNAGQLIMELNSKDADKLEKLEKINTSLREGNVPMHLQERVRKFYDYKLSHGEGINESEVLKDLPEQLKVEICVHLYKNLLLKVPFFKTAEETLLHQIVLKLTPRLFTPNEYIFKFGSIGKEMFFISKGTVEIVSSAGTILATLSEGTFFGEYAVLTSERRMASVRTKTYCNLFVLNKESFDSVSKDFPLFMENVRKIVQERINRNNKNLALQKQQSQDLSKAREAIVKMNQQVQAAAHANTHDNTTTTATAASSTTAAPASATPTPSTTTATPSATPTTATTSPAATTTPATATTSQPTKQ